MDANKLTLMGLSHSEEAKKFIVEMKDGFAEMGLDTDKAKIELFWESLMDAYDEARNKTIDKACEWIAVSGVFNGNTCGDLKRYIEKFRKAMED